MRLQAGGGEFHRRSSSWEPRNPGNPDARFQRAMCPALELGLVGQTMHQIDERVPTSEMEALTRVYGRVVRTVPGPA